MLRHLLKLVWRRKARNLMLTLEIMLAFVVVFAIAAFAARCAQLYTMPLGFAYEQTWSVKFQRADEDNGKAGAEVYEQLMAAVRSLDEVEAAGFVSFEPFTNSSNTNDFKLPDGSVRLHSQQLEMSDDFATAAGLNVLEGRWFNQSDATPGVIPVLLNARLAKALFRGQSALGKRFVDETDDPAKAEHFLVTGVVEDYRHQGDFGSPANLVLRRFDPTNTGFGVRGMTLKLRTGVKREFENKLITRLKQVRGDWDYTVTPQSEARESQLKSVLLPLIIFSVIALFMLIMVAFGLFGVLWQNTARRIPEIGLRRAIGASASQIYGQIISEQLILSSLAMLGAGALLVQLPLTGVFGASMDWKVFGASFGLSALVIYLISLVCAAYPGWRASRLTPTEALHYE